MPKLRIPASARTGKELRSLSDGWLAGSEEHSALLRLATRLIVGTAAMEKRRE